ncbi:MAG: LacI family DNA-binding transcriptional regulator [Eubacteriales bacterium]|nr:LacI family DNA-binding transcriptional regulator [Eubacteriales bacterium]
MLEVAKRAHVSIATVSRVLNGQTNVAPEMAARVTEAVRALAYEPNLIAQNLRRNESRTLVILTPNITNPYYANIISGIAQGAQENGYSSFLFNTEGKRALEEQILERLKKHQADGAIMLAAELGADWIYDYAKEYPVVQCSEFDPRFSIPHVCVDNEQATKDVMAYLLSLGHTRIGTISIENRFHSTAARLHAYKTSLVQAGIPVEEDYIRYATQGYTFKMGLKSARSLLAQEKRPTALFCVSDMLALGAIAGAKEMGFRVPNDVTVIGFDDVEYTTMFHPYVTTVVQPCYQIGHTAVELVCGLIQRQQVPQEVILPHNLVIRESSAPFDGYLANFASHVTGC